MKLEEFAARGRAAQKAVDQVAKQVSSPNRGGRGRAHPKAGAASHSAAPAMRHRSKPSVPALEHLPLFIDLPGRPGKTRCLTVTSVGQALHFLKRVPITASGETGSLNCYRDSEGWWHGVFYRYRVTLSDERFGSLVDLAGWLKKWFPELGDQDKAAI